MAVRPSSVLAPDVRRKRCRPPGNPSVGSRRDRRHPLLLRQQRPGAVRAVGQPPPASEAGSRAPAPRRFAHRITDMAPMLRHADPCRASPCRPCCLLSALNRARPRSRAPTGSSPVRRLPKRPRFRACSASSPRLPSPCCSAIFSFKPCFSGAQGRRRQQRKLPDVGSALRSHDAELATAKRRPLPPGRACHSLPFPGLHGDERRAGRGFGARVRRVVHA